MNKDVGFIQEIFDHITNCQADGTAYVLGAVEGQQVVERHLRSPEDGGGEDAHEGVEEELLGIILSVFGGVVENPLLVQNIFDHQPRQGSNCHGKVEGSKAVVKVEDQPLKEQVHQRGDKGEEGVFNDQHQ